MDDAPTRLGVPQPAETALAAIGSRRRRVVADRGARVAVVLSGGGDDGDNRGADDDHVADADDEST